MRNRFVVDMSDVKMSDKAAAEIQGSIQKTVLESLVNLRVSDNLAIRFPREWWGIILNPEFDRLGRLDKEINESLN